MSESLLRAAPYLASALAVVLSILNLYFHRRDRTPRLRIRIRYEYRAEPASDYAFHAHSQQRLYMRLGEFLRANELSYLQAAKTGIPLVRFAVSNPTTRTITLTSVRLVLRTSPFGRMLVLSTSNA